MENIIQKAEKLFLKMVEDFKEDPYFLKKHIKEMQKWAEIMLKKYPEADREIVLLSVWLHDIGHYPLQTKEDHAVTGEKIAKTFLQDENYPIEKLTKVLHCIRAHRCKDVMPETLEAKMTAFIDSASHMTDETVYPRMLRSGDIESALSKLERDYRDLTLFEKEKNELKDLYLAWKNLIKELGRYKKLEK